MGEETISDLVLNVTMFGDFKISLQGKVLDSEIIRSDMVTKLLTYMVCHRKGSVTVQELSDALWNDEENENPVGALKNLMYRLRTILKNNFGDYPFILTGRGCYLWNTDIKVLADTERFEQLCKQAEGEKNGRERLTYEMEAAEIYVGKLLPQYANEYWIMSLYVYYHSMYLSMVKDMVRNLEAENRYFEMEEICHRAIGIDEFDEDLHYYLIKALIYENKYKIAMEQYNKTCELLQRSIGVRPSEKLRSIYDEILRQNHEIETDISIIMQELTDKSRVRRGAFICDYGVFKKNYELELRRAKRGGNDVYLCLITITPELKYNTDSESYSNTIKRGASQIQNVMMESLRAGDIITRYSTAQFIVMLPVNKSEDAHAIMKRVETKFNEIENKTKVKVAFSLDHAKM